LAAYREEVENMKTYPAHKLRERQLVLEHALEALGHPGNRAMYHEGRIRGQAVTGFGLILNLGEKAGFGIRVFQ